MGLMKLFAQRRAEAIYVSLRIRRPSLFIKSGANKGQSQQVGLKLPVSNEAKQSNS